MDESSWAGSIAYFGPSSQGYFSPLRTYFEKFYDNLLVTNPHYRLGDVIRKTYAEVVALEGIVHDHTAQSMNLQGDPALHIFRLDTADVWPGDTDADGIAHHVDVLNIGLAYGNIGVGRPQARLQWQAQRAINWDSLFHAGLNYKHADCNGDGIVNTDDTLAIHLNYGLIHPKRVCKRCHPPHPELPQFGELRRHRLDCD